MLNYRFYYGLLSPLPGRMQYAMIFDLAVVVAVILMGLAGFRDGLVRGLVKLAGFILTILLMTVYASEIAALGLMFGDIPPKIAVPGAFVAVFAVAVIGSHVLAIALSKLISLTPIKFLDSGLGCVFGVIKATFIAGLAALALSYAPAHSMLHQEYQSARFARPLHHIVLQSVPYLKTAARAVYDRIVPLTNDEILPEKIRDADTLI